MAVLWVLISKKPEAPLATSYAPQPLHQETAAAPVHAGELQKFNVKAAIPFDWWTMFHSPQINSLIERAFKANPTIQSGQAALRRLQQNVIAQEGFFLSHPRCQLFAIPC